MTFRAFLVPEYHEFVDLLGVGPEPVAGEDVRTLRFESDDEDLVVTFDIPGRSVPLSLDSQRRRSTPYVSRGRNTSSAHVLR